MHPLCAKRHSPFGSAVYLRGARSAVDVGYRAVYHCLKSAICQHSITTFGRQIAPWLSPFLAPYLLAGLQFLGILPPRVGDVRALSHMAFWRPATVAERMRGCTNFEGRQIGIVGRDDSFRG